MPRKATTKKTATASKSKKRVKAPSLQEVQEKIQVRAYQIYETRVQKNKQGSQVSDWVQAEKEVKTKLKIT